MNESALLARLSALLAERLIPVIDRLVVYDGRWRSVDCHNPACCPPGGTRVPDPAEMTHVVAEFVAAGVAAVSTRADLRYGVQVQPAAADVRRIIDRIGFRGKEIGTSGLSSDSVADSWARVLGPPNGKHQWRHARLPWCPP